MARATNSRRFQKEATARARANAKAERYTGAGLVVETRADGTVNVYEPYTTDEQSRVIKGQRVKRRPVAPDAAGEDTPTATRP